MIAFRMNTTLLWIDGASLLTCSSKLECYSRSAGSHFFLGGSFPVPWWLWSWPGQCAESDQEAPACGSWHCRSWGLFCFQDSRLCSQQLCTCKATLHLTILSSFQDRITDLQAQTQHFAKVGHFDADSLQDKSRQIADRYDKWVNPLLLIS